MFKFVVLACVLAVVSASGYVGHLGYGHSVGHGIPIVSHTVGHSAVVVPSVVKAIVPATYTSHVVAAPVVSHGVVGYGHHGGYGHGYGHGYGGLINHGGYGLGYGHGYGLGYGHGYGGLLIKK